MKQWIWEIIGGIVVILFFGLLLLAVTWHPSLPEEQVLTLHEGTVVNVQRTSSGGLFSGTSITVNFTDGYQFYSGPYFTVKTHGDIYLGGTCKIVLSNKQTTGNFGQVDLYFSK
jgi:hypothetical protein